MDKLYRKLEVNEMPVIKILEKLDYKKLLVEYQVAYRKPLKPVVRGKNSEVKVPTNLICTIGSTPISIQSKE